MRGKGTGNFNNKNMARKETSKREETASVPVQVLEELKELREEGLPGDRGSIKRILQVDGCRGVVPGYANIQANITALRETTPYPGEEGG